MKQSKHKIFSSLANFRHSKRLTGLVVSTSKKSRLDVLSSTHGKLIIALICGGVGLLLVKSFAATSTYVWDPSIAATLTNTAVSGTKLQLAGGTGSAIPGLGSSLTFFTLTSSGSGIYVSPSGSDSNTGSISSPYKTVPKALSVVAAGQTVYLRQGSYDCSNTAYFDGSAPEARIQVSGTSASSPVTLTSYAGEMGTITNCMVWIGSSYVKVDRVTIDGQHTLDDLDMFVTQNAHNVIISNNTVLHGGKTGTANHAGSGIFTDHGTANNEIINNTFHDNGSNEYHHGLYVNGDNYLIANNLVYNNYAFGIQVYPGLTNSIITSNTVVGNGYGDSTHAYSGFVIGDDGSAYMTTGNKIYNNITAFNKSAGFQMCWSVCGGAVGAGNDISNNVNYGNGSAVTLDGDNKTNFGPSITTDPKFANRAGNDYTLLSGSSAIDKATSPYSGYTPPYDITGVARSGGAAGDIGAYEFGSGSSGYATSGTATYTFDGGAGKTLDWAALSYTGTTPTGTTVTLDACSTSDGSACTSWVPIASATDSRYLRVRVSLSTTNSAVTPTIDTITLTYTDVTATNGNFYVDTATGSDTNSGTSSSPWKTLQKAADTVTAGSTVYVRNGTYAGFSETTSGTSSSRITYTADTGATPVIQGDASRRDVVLISGSYVTVSNMTVASCVPDTTPTGSYEDGGSSGVRVDDSTTNVTVSGMTIRDSHGTNSDGLPFGCYGVMIHNASNATVTANNIYHNGYGVFLKDGGSGVVISNNQIHDNDVIIRNTVVANDDYGASAIGFTKTTGSTAYGNTIYNNRGPSHDYSFDGGGFEIYQASSTNMHDNTLYNNENVLESGQNTGGPGCNNNSFTRNVAYGGTGAPANDTVGMILRCGSNMLVANNTFDSIFYWVFDIQNKTTGFAGPIDNMKIVNNSISQVCDKVYAIEQTLPATVVIDYNDSWQSGSCSTFASVPAGNVANFAAFKSATGYDTHTINTNPLYTSRSGFDFHPTASSPLINAGTTVSGITDSFTGTAPDIGYYEVTSSDTTPPTISAVASTAVTSAAATVTWTTNEASDSQVDYGTTTSYGSSTTLNSSLVTTHSVNLSGLTPSTAYHYRVKSKDAAANLATGTDNIFTTTAAPDTTAPTVNLTAPTTGATVSGSSVAVTATATDNVGVASVQFKLDGANLNAADTTGSPYATTWNSTTATNGSHTLTAIATDTSSNTTTSSSVTVTVNNTTPDTTNPTVSITAPTNGTTVSGSSVAVTATAADNIGVIGVQFKLDGANLSAEDTASPYSTTFNASSLSVGSHTITAIARDAAGNTATATTVTVTVADTTAPTPPTALHTTTSSGSSVSLAWTSSTDAVGVTGYRIYRGLTSTSLTQIGSVTTPIPPATSYTDSTVNDGTTYYYAVAAYDAASNLSAQTTALSVATPDTTAPSVPGSLRLNGSVTTTTVPLIWNSSSDNVSVTGYNIYRGPNSSSLTKIGTSATTTYTDSTASASTTYVYAIAAYDAIPNTSAQSTTLSVTTATPPDTTPPTASLTAPSSGAAVSGASVAFSATATDPGSPSSGVATVQFLVDGAAVATDTTSPYSYVWNSQTVSNGSHTITAIATDNAAPTPHSTTSASVTITVNNITPDITAPTVPAALHTTTANTTTSVAFAWTGSTDTGGSNLAGYKIYRNGTLQTSVGPTTTAYSDTGLTPSTTYSYTVSAYDGAGNTSAQSLAFSTRTADVPVPPVVSAITSTGITTTTATITWTTNVAADTQVDYGTTTSYGTTTPLNASLTTSHSVSLTGLTPATTYHYRVRSKDAVPTLTISADGSFTTTSNATGGTPTPPTPPVTPPTSTKVGDVNNDKQVNFTDLIVLLSNYGSTSNTACDLNKNGQVDFGDLILLLSNYGK